jgi:hypothetical protein
MAGGAAAQATTCGMTYRSEYGEDKWIAEHLDLPAVGRYMDIGCGDPINGSNTAFLRDRGWAGLAVDANPGYADYWRGKADFVQAIVSTKAVVRFAFNHECPGQSRQDFTATAYAATTLARLHAACGGGRIDFLSLDVEGQEFDALLSLGPDVFPTIIVSEYSTWGLPDDNQTLPYLLDRGYELEFETRANRVFSLL